jgi:hypothetical protein
VVGLQDGLEHSIAVPEARPRSQLHGLAAYMSTGQ